MKNYFFDLYRAGKGIFAIAHTQLRTVIDKGAENTEGYQILTSNLTTKYEGVFGDIFDFVMTGTIDRELEPVKINANKSTNLVKSEVRKLYFRGNTRVEAGGRFASNTVPEYMVFEGDETAREFLDIVEGGMLKSATGNKVDKLTDKEKEEIKKELFEINKSKTEDIKKEIVDSDKYSEYADVDGIEFIKDNWSNEKFSNGVKEILTDLNVTNVKSLDTEGLIRIIKFGVEEVGLEI